MGMRPVNDPLGGSTMLVDKMIGNAFDVVKEVQTNLAAINYLVANMQAIVTLAEQVEAQRITIINYEARISALEAQV